MLCDGCDNSGQEGKRMAIRFVPKTAEDLKAEAVAAATSTSEVAESPDPDLLVVKSTETRKQKRKVGPSDKTGPIAPSRLP